MTLYSRRGEGSTRQRVSALPPAEQQHSAWKGTNYDDRIWWPRHGGYTHNVIGGTLTATDIPRGVYNGMTLYDNGITFSSQAAVDLFTKKELLLRNSLDHVTASETQVHCMTLYGLSVIVVQHSPTHPSSPPKPHPHPIIYLPPKQLIYMGKFLPRLLASYLFS